MRRTQISLGEDQHRFLIAEAARLITERMTGRRDEEDPLDALAGFVEGDGSSVAVDHDRYLYGDPRD